MNDKLRKKRNCAKVCIMRNINIFGFSLRRKWEFHTRKNVERPFHPQLPGELLHSDNGRKYKGRINGCQ